MKCGILNNDSDIIALTETWLNSNVLTAEFCDTRTVIRKDRDLGRTCKKQGGGVLLAIKTKYRVLECKIFDDELEAICVKVEVARDSFLYVVVVYFVPGTGPELYGRFYHNIEINLMDRDTIILGDFNLRNFVS